MSFRSLGIYILSAAMGAVCLYTLSAHTAILYAQAASTVDGSDISSSMSNDELAAKIKERQASIESLNQQIDSYSRILGEKQGTISTLKNQIQTLDDQIKKAELIIQLKNEQIGETGLEINGLETEIASKEKDVTRQKDNIGEFIRVIQQNSQRSPLEILLSNDSLSNFYDQEKFLQDVQGDLKKSLTQVKLLKEQLEIEQKSLSDKKSNLENLVESLKTSQVVMEGSKVVKGSLLSQTKSDEKKYSVLLDSMRAEQAQANNDIVTLEKALRSKLAKEGSNTLDSLKGQKLIWPIASRVITAHFHDPDYPFRNVFEHPAIDIRTPQGTIIHAAASGYVSRAKDAGFGYSYISIIHADGLSTVYGHVSCISVKEGEFVVQGQAVGCSGGLPGTRGAGNLTTGAHLHLEVRLNGIPVNPEDYLP